MYEYVLVVHRYSHSDFCLCWYFFIQLFQENPPQQAARTSDDTVCTDAVEAFTLDEDFDYDNVILTPKFSAEDMAILINCAK